MAKINGLRKILAYPGIILFFIVLAYAYLFPLLEGKTIRQHDIEHWRGMAKELVDYREDTGEEALWTNSMFGGMPSFMISTVYKGNFMRYIHQMVRSLHPASIIILYMVGFFILLLSLRIKKWLCVAGAIAFGLSSYFIIIIGAGHNTKGYAIGYLPLVIAGVILSFRGKPVAGSLLFTVAFSLLLNANHLQITYYGFLIIALYGLVQLVFQIREKEVLSFLKAFGFLLIGAIIALGINFSRLYSTWEYSRETIRGPSELTSNNENKTSGLDKDYVVQWSYGIDETLTLLIPNFKGGGSQINPGTESESYRALTERNIQNPRRNIQAVSMYHGEQPSTSGPVYVGAIIVFLFVLGLFIMKGPYKWWLLSATVVSIVLSWGGNVMGLTSFLLDYLPFYNKFRAPSMTLVIAQFAMPLLGIIALNDILKGKVDKNILKTGLKWSFITVGGVALLFSLLPGLAGSFSNATDAMRFPDWLMDSIIADRKDMLRTDAFRSFVFIALAAGGLYLWHIGKVKTNSFIAVIGLLILVDLWAVDKRYLNNDDFVRDRTAENPFPKMPVDETILKDQDLNYRVLPLQYPFQNARSSYYHKSVGGYHAAKLRRYQDLIDHHLQPEIEQMVNGLQEGSPLDSVFRQLPVINMLNTRYVIYDLNENPIPNPFAFGNAWFVDDYEIVENADEEIAAMKSFSASETAIIDQRYQEFVKGKQFKKDNDGAVVLTEYQPNYLKYSVEASARQLTVFSEIYYAKGWKAFIDGRETPHFRANYVLRAMVIPEGEHTVEFRFEPRSYSAGNRISLGSSILLILALAGYGLSEIRKKRE